MSEWVTAEGESQIYTERQRGEGWRRDRTPSYILVERKREKERTYEEKLHYILYK